VGELNKKNLTEMDMTALRELADRWVDTVNEPKPTKAAMAELQKAMVEYPAIFKVLGDTTSILQMRILEHTTSKPGMLEVMKLRAKTMTRELGYEKGSPLERMLIDHVVTAWLRVQMIEWRYQTFSDKGGSFKEGAYWDNKLNSAHRRYLRAVETLARVRRLLQRTPVQINIANQQVVQNG
jgi:hypothetical protein